MHNIFVRSGIVLFLCVGVACFCFFLPQAKVSNEAGVVLQLPEKVKGYSSVKVDMSQKEKDWLPGSTRYTKRTYYPEGASASSWAAISVSLIVSGGDERSLHRPSVCMDGQGWAIPTKMTRTFEVDGQEIELMDLFLKRVIDGQVYEAHYYFFWVGRGISTSSYARMKWLSLVDNFTKNVNHRWAYPGIFVHVHPGVEDRHEHAWRRAKHVIQEVVPHFHKDFGAEEPK